MSFKRGLAEDEEDWQIAREAVICEGKVNGKGWPEAIANFQEAKTLDFSLDFDLEAPNTGGACFSENGSA